MATRLLSCAISAVVLLSGCAATVKRSGSSQVIATPDGTNRLVLQMSGRESGPSDWETFKGEWRSALRDESERNGYRFQSLEDDTKPDADPGLLVSVRIHDYRYLTPGVRYGFGVMTGNAFIESTVRFVDMASGQRVGERVYNTTSSAWEGVFSAMTSKQVAAIAADIVREVKGTGRVPGQTANPIPKGDSAGALATPPASPPAAPTGTDSYIAERLAKTLSCSASPRASLVAKGPGFESYSVPCSNGDAMAIRCEFGNCRTLR